MKFFNQDEMGIEGVANSVGQGVKKAVNTASDQVDVVGQDVVSHLYGAGESGDAGVEDVGGNNGDMANYKSQTNVRNPAMQQAKGWRGQKMDEGKASEEAAELEKVRKRLHEEQTKETMELTGGQDNRGQVEKDQEEKVYYQWWKDDEEKKRKKQEEEVEEQGRQEDLDVVRARTSVENKGLGAG